MPSEPLDETACSLQQDARSHIGVIRLMQLMLATGASMKVCNIGQVDPNVHAGSNLIQRKDVAACGSTGRQAGYVVRQCRARRRRQGQESVRYVRNVCKYYIANNLFEQYSGNG